MDQIMRQEVEAIVRQCIAECVREFVRVGFGSSMPVIDDLEALKQLHADSRPACQQCGTKLALFTDGSFNCPSCWIGC